MSVSFQEVLDQHRGLFKEVSYNFTDFHLPDIASLPAGLFSTPTKLSWRHACIYPLPADLFSIPTGLQTLPIAHINIFIYPTLLRCQQACSVPRRICLGVMLALPRCQRTCSTSRQVYKHFPQLILIFFFFFFFYR